MGGAMGGIVFPLMLQDLLPRLGFAWATRIMALIIGILCLISNLLVRGGMKPSKQHGLRQYLPRFQILADPAFALTTFGVLAMEFGLFIPIAYITSFVISTHIGSASFAFKALAVLNAGSAIGRFLPGVFADHVGRFNAMIVLLFMCMLTTLAFWMPAALLGNHPSNMATDFTASPSMKPLIISYALLFGFASGANISLTPVCVGQLCRTEEYGRYYATCYMIVSFSCLTGLPIAGALLQLCGGEYYGVTIFTSACYIMSFVAFVAARVVRVGWRVKKDGKWVIF
jgi:predicted MFS family arabinose efflux permease